MQSHTPSGREQEQAVHRTQETRRVEVTDGEFYDFPHIKKSHGSESRLQAFSKREDELRVAEMRLNEVWEMNMSARLELYKGKDQDRVYEFFLSRNNREMLKKPRLASLPIHEAMEELRRQATDPEYAKAVAEDERQKYEVLRREITQEINTRDKEDEWKERRADGRTINEEISAFTGGCAVLATTSGGTDSEEDQDFY